MKKVLFAFLFVTSAAQPVLASHVPLDSETLQIAYTTRNDPYSHSLWKKAAHARKDLACRVRDFAFDHNYEASDVMQYFFEPALRGAMAFDSQRGFSWTVSESGIITLFETVEGMIDSNTSVSSPAAASSETTDSENETGKATPDSVLETDTITERALSRLPRSISRAQGDALDVRLAVSDLPETTKREIPHTEIRETAGELRAHRRFREIGAKTFDIVFTVDAKLLPAINVLLEAVGEPSLSLDEDSVIMVNVEQFLKGFNSFRLQRRGHFLTF